MPRDNLQRTYKIELNNYKERLKQTKILYMENLINRDKNRTKVTWKIIDAELGRKKTIKSDIRLKEPSYEVTQPLEVANRFEKKHFSSVAADEVRKKFSSAVMACTVSQVEITAQFPNTPITEEEVIEKLYLMKNKTSSGINDLSVITLKQIIAYILTPFTFLLNLSISQGVFPNALKTSLIIPLYKKGE